MFVHGPRRWPFICGKVQPPLHSNQLLIKCRHAWSTSGMISMTKDIPQSFQKPPYYDSWDPIHRHEIPKEDIENNNYRPVDIDNGDVNPLYNADGWHIPLVSFLHQETLPALFDLAAIQRLYNDSEPGHTPTFYRYPLANLHSYGNF